MSDTLDVDDAPPRRSRWRRVRRRLDLRWVSAGLVLALLVATVVLVPLITTTSAEVREASAGPPPTTLTEPVVRRSLSAQVVTRGSVVTRGQLDLTCTPAASVGNAGGTTVFTRAPSLGARVANGGVVAAVNGRPVIAMVGAVAAFRDILPGATGSDVRQLQGALERLGYDIDDRRGTYGPSTQRAVEKVYATAGFTPAGPSDEDRARLRAAVDEARSAAAAVTQARAALVAARKGASREEVLRARIAADAAAAAVKAGPASGPQHELLVLQAADARRRVAALRQTPDTRAERTALAVAAERQAQAEAERGRVAAAVGIRIPFCEMVFVPSLPASVVAARTAPDGASAPGATSAATAGSEAGATSDPGGGSAADAPGASWATLAPGALTIEATVSAQDGRLLHAGDTVRFAADGGPDAGTGTIRGIRAVGADAVLDIAPGRPLPARSRGSDVRVTIATSSTKGVVLAVPTAAVKGRADGGARVTVIGPGGESRDVPVTAGLSADGYVEVNPADPAQPLAAGDAVVVAQ